MMWAFLLQCKQDVLTANQVGIYGYGLNHDPPLAVSLPLASAKRLHKTIRENFGTLVFCRRYLDRLGLDRYLAGVSITTLALGKSVHTDVRQMNCLVSNGIVEPYQPLTDIEGSYSAQFEHVSSCCVLRNQRAAYNGPRLFSYVRRTKKSSVAEMTTEWHPPPSVVLPGPEQPPSRLGQLASSACVGGETCFAPSLFVLHGLRSSGRVIGAAQFCGLAVVPFFYPLVLVFLPPLGFSSTVTRMRRGVVLCFKFDSVL